MWTTSASPLNLANDWHTLEWKEVFNIGSNRKSDNKSDNEYQ